MAKCIVSSLISPFRVKLDFVPFTDTESIVRSRKCIGNIPFGDSFHATLMMQSPFSSLGRGAESKSIETSYSMISNG